MILYFAMPNNEPDLMAVLITEHTRCLYSYHYFGEKLPWLKELRKKYKIKDFIDSGAFSAHSQGVSIDLDSYIEFLHELKPHFYVGLDDLGSYKITLENQRIMEEAGLKPAPTFHLGEPISVLEYFIERYDYIALGGMVGAGSSNITTFLNGVWSVILRKKPKLKVHGFGLTTLSIIKQYPFYSVDSSSYSAGVRFASVARWAEKKQSLYTQEFWKYCREHKIKYERGGVITGETRNICIGVSCDAYQEMIESVDRFQRKRDFSYLTAQLNLFK